MKRVISVISVLLLMCCTACGGTVYDSSHADVTVNMPEDDTVNGYRTAGRSDGGEGMPDALDADDVVPGVGENTSNGETTIFVGNKSSHVFHRQSCSSASKMKNEKCFVRFKGGSCK